MPSQEEGKIETTKIEKEQSTSSGFMGSCAICTTQFIPTPKKRKRKPGQAKNRKRKAQNC